MTITAQTSKTGPYNGNGTTTVFSYTFEVQDEAHLVVTLADATGVETVQVLNVDYTVSGVGNPNGGQITMSTAPVVGYTLTISRSIPITQEVDLENRRSVAPEVLEDAYDKLTQIAQDLNEQVGRAVKISVTEGGNPALTLQGDVQANTFLGFDAVGNIALLAPPSGAFISPNASLVAVDAFIGDGTTVDFTLGGIPLSPTNLFIFLDGVMQDAANYTVSGSLLTFTTAPPLNSNIEIRRFQAIALNPSATTADLVSYEPAGVGAQTTTVEAKLKESVSVKDFGAVGDGVTDDTAAIQGAIDFANSEGGKRVWFPSATYRISAALVLYNRVTLDLDGGGIIEQATDGVYIVDCTGTASVTSRFAIENGRLRYVNQQSAVGGSAIRLASTTVTTSNWLLSNLSISKAYHSVYIPDGANTFLGQMKNVTSADSESYGFVFGGGASVHTNIRMSNVWAVQTNGSERPTSRGFSLKNIQELSADTLAVDGAQQVPVVVDTCTGSIENLALERCTRTSSSGGVAASVSLATSRIYIGTFLATGNTVNVSGSTDFAWIFSDLDCITVVDHFRDNDTALTIGTGGYYSFYNADADSVIYNTSALSAGTSPAVATNDASANTPARTRVFNGSTKLLDLNGVYVGVKTSAPTTLGYPDGSFVINSAPSAGGPLGWRRVGSNWLPVSETATDTTTNIEDISNTVNTVGKFEGKQVFNTTTNKPVYAAGSAAADVWVDATGATAHTPT